MFVFKATRLSAPRPGALEDSWPGFNKHACVFIVTTDCHIHVSDRTCSESLVSAADVDQMVTVSGSMKLINELDCSLLLRTWLPFELCLYLIMVHLHEWAEGSSCCCCCCPQPPTSCCFCCFLSPEAKMWINQSRWWKWRKGREGSSGVH